MVRVRSGKADVRGDRFLADVRMGQIFGGRERGENVAHTDELTCLLE